MRERLGWQEPADGGIVGREKTIVQKRGTYDLERLIEGATLKCSEFADATIENLG